MSLLASLPVPTKTYAAPEPELPTPSGAKQAPGVIREVPPYGRRQGFVPRRVEDFGDGAWLAGEGAARRRPGGGSAGWHARA